MTFDEIFSPHCRLEQILNFESALARALASAGIVRQSAADSIAAECETSRFDLAAIAHDARNAGNDVIPAVERLRALVAKRDESAADYVHWGATSQDVIDTALVLQLRTALMLIETEAGALTAAITKLVHDHAATPMAGRTWLQQASPTTFGFKVAGWLDAMHRHHDRLRAARDRVCVLQFGGSVGTLAALGNLAPRVAAALGDELRLSVTPISWHATRDRVVEVATTLALLVGTLGKIARDIALLAQTELGEVHEPAGTGRGRSSTMPHKRNPVGCAHVLAASVRAPGLAATMLSAMSQEHERGLGGWQAEWDVLPEMCILTFDALSHMRNVVSCLHVDAACMARNIEETRGLIFSEAASFALVPRLGRDQAKAALDGAMRRAAENDTHLRDELLADPVVRARFSEQEVRCFFDLAPHVDAAHAIAQSVARGERRG